MCAKCLKDIAMRPPIHRLIIYTAKMDEMCDFYSRYFGFEVTRTEGDALVELRGAEGGLTLLLHPAAKGQRMGQALVKLVFDVADVPGFCATLVKKGLAMGKVHKGDGYVFANGKDPSGNSISVSSRAFAERR